MPHYRNGDQAKAGDLVVGTSYNLKGRKITGTVIEVIPGCESCNLRVAFVDVSTLPSATIEGGGIMYRASYDGDLPPYTTVVMKPAYDYGETKDFMLLARAGETRVQAAA